MTEQTEWLSAEMRSAGFAYLRSLDKYPGKDAASLKRKRDALAKLTAACVNSGHDRYEVLRVLDTPENEAKGWVSEE